MKNIGILGLGNIANRVAKGVLCSKKACLYAVASRNIENAKYFAEKYGAKIYYGNYEEMLNDPKVDVVYICTPNTLHFEQIEVCLSHGKHVICEKPMVKDEVQVRQLFAKARECGCFLMEAQKMLFLPAVLKLKKAIDSGRLGRIRQAEFTHTFLASYNGWMFDNAAGGGPLLSSGIYVIELMQFLFGCKVEDIGGFRTLHEGTDVEEEYVLSGRMENGVLFQMKNSTCALMKNGAVIHGEKGHAELPDYWKARRVTFASDTGETEILEFPCEHELVYEVRHISECMERGLTESPVVTGRFSADAIAVIERIKRMWSR